MWLKSYLTNRQHVSVGEVHSSTRNISIGVPQVSILGPLLFLVDISDMKNCSSVLKFVHFADDTAVIFEGHDIQDLCTSINRELAYLDSWLCINRPSLNEDKTSLIMFSNVHRHPISDIRIGEFKVKQVDCAKYLGIIIER